MTKITYQSVGKLVINKILFN